MKQFDHQIEGTRRIQETWDQQRAGVLIAAEQGCGKTRMVLDFLADKSDKRTLIVCPAIARGEWLRQASLWTPQLKLLASDKGKTVEAWPKEPGIFVTSYQLLRHVRHSFDCIVTDECQYISSPEALMTRELNRVINLSEDTLLVSLSGTPALNQPDQLWSVLRMLEPGKWGDSIWTFRRRYCEAVPNEWAPSGFVYKGLLPDRADELRDRLAKVMFRVRKSDIADSLPPLLMSMRYIKPKRSKLDWDSEDNFSQLLELNSSAKFDATVDVVEQAVQSGESKFVVFTYLRQSAENLGVQLQAIGLEVEVVTGATPADQRHAPIERIRTSDKPAVLICNIDAVGIALDMVFCTTAVFAEMSWVPGKTSQALGRLIRLSSRHACNCIFVVVEGSKEQRQAEEFCRKQGNLDLIIASGRDESAAASALSRVQSDEDILKELVA